jgi:hypothetical protein
VVVRACSWLRAGSLGGSGAASARTRIASWASAKASMPCPYAASALHSSSAYTATERARGRERWSERVSSIRWRVPVYSQCMCMRRHWCAGVAVLAFSHTLCALANACGAHLDAGGLARTRCADGRALASLHHRRRRRHHHKAQGCPYKSTGRQCVCTRARGLRQRAAQAERQCRQQRGILNGRPGCETVGVRRRRSNRHERVRQPSARGRRPRHRQGHRRD